jgi:hypothetical protein
VDEKEQQRERLRRENDAKEQQKQIAISQLEKEFKLNREKRLLLKDEKGVIENGGGKEEDADIKEVEAVTLADSMKQSSVEGYAPKREEEEETTNKSERERTEKLGSTAKDDLRTEDGVSKLSAMDRNDGGGVRV